MLFSVLIPLYNSEEYIGECLDSVLSQDFQDYEIVVIDDGSTDNSGMICDEYKSRFPERIKVIHKANEGVLLTRRRAIREAEGDYLLWIDSDDCYKKDLMCSLYIEIKANDPDMLIWNYETMSKDDGRAETIHCLSIPDKTVISGDQIKKIYEQMLIGRDMNELWTKCFRRNLVDLDADYQEFSHVKMGDDLFCLFPIMDRVKKIEYLDKSYYSYRLVDSSITHSKDYKRYYSYRTIFERATYYLTKWALDDDVCQRAKDQFVNRIISCITLASEGSIGYQEFKTFVKKINYDESVSKIYSEEKRKLSSRFNQMCYGLLIHKRYWLLYCFVNAVVKYRRLLRDVA